jgi:competence protein ComEA
MAPMPSQQANLQAQTTQQVWQQQTIPHATTIDPSATGSSILTDPLTTSTKKRVSVRIVAAAIVIALAIALYLIWHAPTTTTSSPIITQQNYISTAAPSTTNVSTDTSGFIQVYIVGAVKHPGVYKLPADARVYQLLQAAGGPLPNANLVALNMAAKLTDGQEVYVTVVGETPPTYLGGVPGPGTPNAGSLVNINTASAAEMQQMLHISSKTAQTIIDYRLQHGNYSSVEELSQVVSKSIYDKIKGLVTV